MRRYVLILGLLIAGSASAQAATLYRQDTHHHVFINNPGVASSFDAVPGSSTRHDDVNDSGRWDPWGHRGAYYGPMIAAPF